VACSNQLFGIGYDRNPTPLPDVIRAPIRSMAVAGHSVYVLTEAALEIRDVRDLRLVASHKVEGARRLSRIGTQLMVHGTGVLEFDIDRHGLLSPARHALDGPPTVHSSPHLSVVRSAQAPERVDDDRSMLLRFGPTAAYANAADTWLSIGAPGPRRLVVPRNTRSA
jgi:hypothetical protein